MPEYRTNFGPRGAAAFPFFLRLNKLLMIIRRFQQPTATFSRSYFYRAFALPTPFHTYSERLASQNLQVTEIFEPEESADDTKSWQCNSDGANRFLKISPKR